jgi:hypothetical protein
VQDILTHYLYKQYYHYLSSLLWFYYRQLGICDFYECHRLCRFFLFGVFISTGVTTINPLPSFISPRKYGFTLYTIMIGISSYHVKSLYGYYLRLVKSKVVGWGYFHTHKPVPKMKIHLIFDQLHLRLPIDSKPSPLSW